MSLIRGGGIAANRGPFQSCHDDWCLDFGEAGRGPVFAFRLSDRGLYRLCGVVSNVSGRSRESSRSLVLPRCSDWVTWRSRPAVYLVTGLVDLDQLTEGIGGWPRGRICEVFGPQSVGVTTLLVQTLAAAQQHGGIVAFVDIDCAFIPEYARRLGCAVEDIFIAQPDDGPMAIGDRRRAGSVPGAFDAIVLDSVPALYSPVRDQEAVDARNESLERARLLSDAMRRLAANVDRTRTVVLFGNRRAERADSHVEDGATPGGRALRFYSSIRLGMERRDVVQGALGATGTAVKLITVKNKVAPPLRSCEIRLVYGHGFASQSE